MHTYIRLAASNDTNGNPRRVVVALHKNRIEGVADEGYLGEAAAIKALAVALDDRTFPNSCPTFTTTPAERRDLLAMGKRDDSFAWPLDRTDGWVRRLSVPIGHTGGILRR